MHLQDPSWTREAECRELLLSGRHIQGVPRLAELDLSPCSLAALDLKCLALEIYLEINLQIYFCWGEKYQRC